MPVPPQRVYYGPQGKPLDALSAPEYPLTEAGGPAGFDFEDRPLEPYYANQYWWQEDRDDMESDSPDADPGYTDRHFRVPGL